ncbi:MAG: hypothetical protein IKT28_03990 [Rikenellaceae bacterium]|nr:hypothetical protein [Rikenellaceae bacterium]
MNNKIKQAVKNIIVSTMSLGIFVPSNNLSSLSNTQNFWAEVVVFVISS